MSDLNFSDSSVDQTEEAAESVEAVESVDAPEAVDAGEPMDIGEPAIDENVDLDAKDLSQAENEAEHEMDGFHIEEPEVKAEPEVEQEDPYRKFREELRTQPGKWYVIHSYAGYERRVKQNIEVRKASLAGGDEVFQVEVPMEETIEIKQPETTEPQVNERLNVATEIAAAEMAADVQEEAPANDLPDSLPESAQSTDPLATNQESTQVANADVDQSPSSEEQVALAEPVADQVTSDPSVTAESSEDQEAPQPSSNDAIENPLIARVANANPTSQFVQHIVLASAARAEEWVSTQNGLDRAIVVPVSINNARRFAVVSGPFETRTEVRDYIQGMDQTADYWVRTARSLQRIALIGDE